MNIWSSTTRRLLGTFSVFFVLLGTASYFALAGLVEVHESMHSVATYNAGVRTALSLASAVRDQYAHQAHTIILGNDTHLSFHRQASENVRILVVQLMKELPEAQQQVLIRQLAAASEELNRLFYDRIVPAVLAHDQATVSREHARALELVGEIQHTVDAIAQQYGQSIANAEAHAAVVEQDSFRYVALSQLCALLFAVAMAVYIGRSVAGPLSRLQAGAARLAAGDLSTVIRIERGDEFGRLALQFNAMTTALRENQAQLVQSEKLAAIGRLAAGLAHEINNPLGVILGYVRIMKRRSDASDVEELGIIEEEAVRCQVIVEGLLDLARPWKQTPTRIELRELCEELVVRLQESAELTGLSLQVEGTAVTEGNVQALRQVLLNVLKNAVEAAGPSGSVLVRLEQHPSGGAMVQVLDSGPGLTEDVQERLFEAFFTTKHNKRPQGTGLGLAVSQAIVQAHGGRIEAQNGSLGGACFTIELPPAAVTPG